MKMGILFLEKVVGQYNRSMGLPYNKTAKNFLRENLLEQKHPNLGDTFFHLDIFIVSEIYHKLKSLKKVLNKNEFSDLTESLSTFLD